ncbi:MAG: peptide deformylase [Candidatus Humimicrobiaceae bacterium]|jgi:peptide deformylase
MAVKKVRKIGDPVLRETSSNIEKIDKPVLDLVSDMLDTLEEEGGVGLAAPQIGVTRRIILVRYEDKVETYINPEIEIIENKRIEGDEGCLSVYSIQGFQVKRYPKVRIRAKNLKGNTEEFIAEDLLARVIQHEVDHLDGIMFIDHLNAASRRELFEKINELKSN